MNMQMRTQATVTGAKFFKGDVDGSSYDSTTIYVQIPMDESRGTAKGFGSAEYRWGDSANFERIKHLKFPLEAELVIEMVTSGKTQKTVVVGLNPVIAPQAKATGG